MSQNLKFSYSSARGRGATRIFNISPAGPIASVVVTPRTCRFDLHQHFVTSDGFTLHFNDGMDNMLELFSVVKSEHEQLTKEKQSASIQTEGKNPDST